MLLILCAVAFLPGLTALPWYGTESLRVLVAREMYASGDWLRPTVHGRPYLDKPPLYAWIVMSLAKLLGHETIGPGLARTPSVVAATAYVLLIWQAARRMIGRRCGLIAGLLALCNFSLIEYAVRAELDIGFLLFSALATLLLWPIVRGVLGDAEPPRSSAAELLNWLAVYAALVVASFWKAPHAFLFMLLTLLSIAMTRRAWRWLFSFAHLAAGTLAVAIVAAWYVWLSNITSTATVEHKLAVELYHRLVPTSLKYFRDLTLAPVQMYAVTLPASFLAGLLIFKSVRPSLPDEHRPLTRFLACWLIPISVFLLFARADATRYLFPIFAPVTLLAALVWELSSGIRDQGSGIGDTLVRESFLAPNRLRGALPTGLALAGGTAAVGFVILLATGCLPPRPVETLEPGSVLVSPQPSYGWLAVPMLISAPLLMIWCLRTRPRDSSAALILGLLSALLGTKTVHHLWYAPSRALDFEHARRVAGLRAASDDRPLFVLARQPLSEVAIYYPHAVQWPENPEDAFRFTGGRPACFVVRQRDYARDVRFAPDRIVRRTHVQTEKDNLIVLEVAPPTQE